MSNPEPNEATAEWSPCPKGVLGALGGRMRASQTRRSLLKAAGGAATLAAVALLVVSLMPTADPGATNPGGISCQECVAQMPEYHLHLTADSDMAAGDVDAMADHLATCPKCRKHFESEYPGVLATAVTAGLGWVAFMVLGARRA